MGPKFKLTPSQINAIKNSPKGVLPAFLGKSLGKATQSNTVLGSLGRALGKKK